METKGLGAGSYPEPKEEKTRVINGKIWVCYEFETEVPYNWNRDEITEDIKENIDEYTQEIVDIDIDF